MGLCLINIHGDIEGDYEFPHGITNGELIQALFGSDKVIDITHNVRLMGKVGNWFNDGVVADFNKDWWNSPYKKGGE